MMAAKEHTMRHDSRPGRRWWSLALVMAIAGMVQAQPPMPVRVGGNIPPPARLKLVNPVYPEEAKSARVQGVVVLEVTVDPEGRVADVRVLRSVPMLDVAAVEAVQQWEYEPTLLNGVAVPVVMTVTVNFTLADEGPSSRPVPPEAWAMMLNPPPAWTGVTGQPFSAEFRVETTRDAQDAPGPRATTGRMMRDSQGRTRFEVDVLGLPAASGPATRRVVIHDPVAGTVLTFATDRPTAMQGSMRALSAPPRGLIPIGCTTAAASRETLQPLGSQVIEGVEAQGCRSTASPVEPRVGPTREFWYAPELRLVLSVSESSEGTSDLRFRISNLVRGDPDAASFEVPPNYRVQSVSPPGPTTHPPDP
jgi:TonB family protein